MIANNRGFIHSFDTFSTVDGPGIRFVVFMSGCPMRCLYCHNPDAWNIKNFKYELNADDILNNVNKYRQYYAHGGGVTISGGEPLLQMDFLIELCKKLKENNYHVAVDTSGITYSEQTKKKFDELIKYVDLFLLDIKHIDDDEHKKLTGFSNKQVLTFAQYLSDNNKKIWIRHVLVPGITTQQEYLYKLKSFIDTLKTVEQVDVLPYHTFGVYKYDKLGIDYPLKGVRVPNDEEIELANSILHR